MTSEEIIKNIANNLKKLREKRGLTQIQLIEEIGEEKISLRSYKSYENGNSTRVPLLEKIAILADFYKCPVDYIVYNKDSIYTDSFSLKDNLKRLAELIYCMVLIPEKDEDKSSKYYGKYYFLAPDKEVTYFLDKITLLSKEKNDDYKYYGKNDLKLLEYFHSIIEECKDKEKDFSPTKNRLTKVMLEMKEDFDEYYENNKREIMKKRKIGSLD